MDLHKIDAMENKESVATFTELSTRVIAAAIEVHRQLGPGLLEATYQKCLAQELTLTQLEHKVEYPLPVSYKGVQLECGYRIDFLIENALILELKSVDQLQGIHQAQLITYMKLASIKQGLLINFNVVRLKEGIRYFHR